MKKSIFYSIITIVTLTFIITQVYLHDMHVERKYKSDLDITNELYSLAEQGYYEGQKDALNGDIRIVMVKDTVKDSVKWVWSKSPWDDNRKPIFKP